MAPLRCLGGMPPNLRAISEVGMAVIELLAKVFAKLVDLTGWEFDVIMAFVNNWEIVVRSNRQEYPSDHQSHSRESWKEGRVRESFLFGWDSLGYKEVRWEICRVWHKAI